MHVASETSLTSMHHNQHCFLKVPLVQFQVLLTLFSKCFSSFPHGTCSLSVSRQYLALDRIYDPLKTAIPNSPTLRKRLVKQINAADGALTLSGRSVPGHLGHAHCRDRLSRLQFPKDFQVGLFPLRSPLLRESWLVSFPPLSNMLKFGG